MDEEAQEAALEDRIEALDGQDLNDPANKAELSSIKTELKGLRTRATERENEVLTAKYGEDVVNLLPPEVTSYERRTEEAEKLKALVTSTASSATGTDPAPAAKEQEAPAPGAKAVTRGPAPGTSPANAHVEATAKELGALAKDDPAAFYAALDAKYGDEVPTA